MITELRDRRIDGNRAEILATLTPLLQEGRGVGGGLAPADEAARAGLMLAPLEMSVPAADGLVLKGTLTYPDGPARRVFPLAVLAHQYPATRDSFAPLVADLLAAGIATLAFDQRGHGASIAGPSGARRHGRARGASAWRPSGRRSWPARSGSDSGGSRTTSCGWSAGAPRRTSSIRNAWRW